MVAVFADRCPTSKQRPYRAVVITRTVVDLRMVGDDPHSPIRLMILGREFRNGLVGVIWFRQTKPHGHGRKYTQLINPLITLIQRKRVVLRLRRPERVIKHRAALLKFRSELLADI